MADIRINALATTAASTASDDFIAVDGSANGTRKLNAFSPTFGGNLTVSGTLLAANGSTTNPSISFASDTGTGFWRQAAGVSAFSSGGSLSLYFGASGVIAGTAGTNNLTMGSSGAVSLTAGGTNQNITLTPSGTGNVIAGNSFRVGGSAPANSVAGYTSIELGYKGDGLLGGSNDNWWTTNAYFAGGGWKRGANQLVAAINTNAGDFIFKQAGAGAADSAITWTDSMTLYRNGNLLIGTTTDSANGKLQLATHTTSAGGIGFGTDTSLYRGASGIGTLELSASTGTVSIFKVALAGTAKAQFGIAAGATYIDYDGSLLVRNGIGGTTALTLSSSQNMTVEGTGVHQIKGTLLLGNQAAIGASLDVQTANGTASTFRLFQNGVSNWVWSVPASTDALVLSQYGTTEAMRFDSSRNATFAGNIKTAAPSGGTAATWRLGTVASVSPTSPNRTIEVEIGGTTYYIHAKTTND